MSRARWIWLALIALAVVGWIRRGPGPVAHGPGELVTAEPLQEILAVKPTLRHEPYRIDPQARFALDARVLSTRGYSSGFGADLAPIDLTLGWGPMSDSAVLDRIDISQSGRWWHWYASELPIPQREIERHAANMHMVPSDPVLARHLDELRVGQVIHLEGYLINVVDPRDGARWNSSLSRDDTGDGACELVWVEQLRVR